MKTLVIAAALTFTVSLSAEVHKKDVDIKAPDGVNLKGTYFSAGRPGPAMLAAASMQHGPACVGRPGRRSGRQRIPCADGRFSRLWRKRRKQVHGSGYARGGTEEVAVGRGRRVRLPDQAERRGSIAPRGGRSKLRRNAIVGSCGAKSRDPGAPAAFGHGERCGEGLYRRATRRCRCLARPAKTTRARRTASGKRWQRRRIRNRCSRFIRAREHGVPMFAKNPELEPMIVAWLKAQLPLVGDAPVSLK